MKKIVFICLILTFYTYAQKGGLPLADEYYRAGEFAKAASIYQNFTEDPNKLKEIYDKYLVCLSKIKNFESAEKLIKKQIKLNPNATNYKLDLASLYQNNDKQNDANKIIDKIIKSCKEDINLVTETVENLSKKGYTAACKTIYLNARKSQKNDFLFALELSEIYKLEKNTDEMIAELIRVLLMNQNDKEFLKSKFQTYITSDEEFSKFESEIIKRSQEDPNQYLYNDLLLWINLQKKDFYRAFIQAKALDRLQKMQGFKVFEVGKIASENRQYEQSIEIFDYLVREYKSSSVYPQARKAKIETKENWIKNTYPIITANIRTLVRDYENLYEEFGKTQEGFESVRNRALLYAFYLDSKDTATYLLQNILNQQWLKRDFLSQCKMDLADIYLLKNEPWESTLLYSQVEKDQKETPLGHESKLRNAKLSYYTGQFQIAQEHLDVLKLATTREIANDAMDLSLFIIDNTGLDEDSTHQALSEYSTVELLLFQNKFSKAQTKLDSMVLKYKDNTIEDEIYFLQAKLYRKTGEFEKAIKKLETIENRFKTDIYGDDAAFMYAEIIEQNMKNTEKAAALYNKFIIDFPSSIFTSEARKRFRLLRGDALNF